MVEVSTRKVKRVWPGGARRHDAHGNGRFDLISPWLESRLAEWLEAGVRAGYDPWNWAKGIPLSVFLNSAEHHKNLFLKGDRSEDHLAAILFNWMGFLHTEEAVERGALSPIYRDLPIYTNDPESRVVVVLDHYPLSPTFKLVENTE